ncbi:MAG: hypothetical protein AAFY71_11100 [Bacteroidota bacterium]
MSQEKLVKIRCGNCKQVFPKVILIAPDDPSDELGTTLQMNCPLCKANITVDVGEKLPNPDSFLKGSVM